MPAAILDMSGCSSLVLIITLYFPMFSKESFWNSSGMIIFTPKVSKELSTFWTIT